MEKDKLMRLDLAKIDERIRRLQELRRIAGDPEMARILLDCLSTDEEARERLPEPCPKAEVAGSRMTYSLSDRRSLVSFPRLRGSAGSRRLASDLAASLLAAALR